MKNDGKAWFCMRKSGLAVEWEWSDCHEVNHFILYEVKWMILNHNQTMKTLKDKFLKVFLYGIERKSKNIWTFSE